MPIFWKNSLMSIRNYDPAPAIGDVAEFYTVNFGFGLQVLKRINLDIAYEFRWGNDVNSDALRGFSGQDVRRHRILASLICYY